MTDSPRQQLREAQGGGYLPDVDAMNELLSRITYKPGWSFRCYGGYAHPHEVWLEAFHTEPDSRTGDDLPNFRRVSPISWPRFMAPPTEADLLAWLRHHLIEWEVHEMNEWLRLDGALVHDPHECSACYVQGCRA